MVDARLPEDSGFFSRSGFGAGSAPFPAIIHNEIAWRQTMNSSEKLFPVVGIGASAGGLEAISELVAELPAETGMAFLLVQHLAPNQESFLTEILAGKAKIAVKSATDRGSIEPDHFYVIPPNTILTVSDGALRLASREQAERPRQPVNSLFRSLAEEHGLRAVAVVLSGTDADGARGLEEVKAAGGITMAQEPASAKYDGMPKSAIATGCVDFVLTPKELARELVRISRHPYLSSPPPADEPVPEENSLNRIFRLLLGQSGTDFSGYKRSTVRRRLARRMALREITGLSAYLDLLKQDPAEINALAQDFLIRVTGFFRDPETFEGLSGIVFPALFENRSPGEPVRIWVPACASGEEVYSIAIVLLEFLNDRSAATRIQLFGTDLSDLAIGKAREGLYPDNIADDVSPERLGRFFVKVDEHYQISKRIRDMCIFARHDVTRDPPFSRLDLASCRNLLIYLDPGLQRRVVSFFHYSLKPHGFLLLGPSETIGRSSELFHLVDQRYRIYCRQPVPSRLVHQFSADAAPPTRSIEHETMVAAEDPALIEAERGQKEAERLLLKRFAPAAVLINEEHNIIYFHGETGRYLEHTRGPASLHLQQVCRPGLLVELAPAIGEAHKAEAPVLREGVQVEMPGKVAEVSFEVVPIRLAGIDSRYYLILFLEPSAVQSERRFPGALARLWASMRGEGKAALETQKDPQIARLRRELDATRDYLQATLEEHEAAREEMKSAHEEALSANEEFISTNEELETAKEELQSANEELAVTNQELRHRNQELTELNAELQWSKNYLDVIVETMRGPLLVLDGALRVQTANHAFYETFQVQAEATIQRRIYELGDGQWNIPELRALLDQVLPHDRTMRDYQVTHQFPAIGVKTMLLNARRMAGDEHRAEMILLAIEDITSRHHAQRQLEQADRRKNVFLATLAHELRNPMATIQIAEQLLRRDATAMQRDKLARMERGIQRLGRLVDDLLDVARIEHGHIELQKEPVDLVNVVTLAIEDARPEIDECHHILSPTLPGKAISMLADGVRLEQVISNLLSNAAKYTGPGGEIGVSVEDRGDEAVIRVRDNGIGIAPESVPQLFEMFFQADDSFGRTGAGLGIGLSLSKRLVEAHGGSIQGHSEGLGKGSEFTVRLPLKQEAESPAGAPRGPTLEPLPAGAFHRVLIVDDNSDIAELVAELARSLGHEVALAPDGPTALTRAASFRPNIALIDVGLPGMNGYELARRMREIPGMKDVVLIAVTGYGREEDRRTALEAGFNLHLVKPVDAGRLGTLLSTLGKSEQ
jgi:two-component system, chemotaxis family, CheB/CheR fusion protein